MNNIYKFLLIIILLTSCAKDNEEKSLIKETDQELEMINAYKLGYEFLNKGDFFYSGKNICTYYNAH